METGGGHREVTRLQLNGRRSKRSQTLLGLFSHSPLFHNHLVTSCTNQKIKAEKGGGKISVMCAWAGGGGRKSREAVPGSTALDRAMYGPCHAGSEQELGEDPGWLRDGGGP